MTGIHRTRRLLVICLVATGLAGACSPTSTPTLGTVEPAERTRKELPRFRLEAVEVAGEGLAPREVRKRLRMRMPSFRFCYYNYL